MALFFWFDLFSEARAEILESNKLAFWKIWKYQKDISKLTLPFLIDSSKVPTASKKAKLDLEKKKTEKKIADMASAFGFEEEDE